MLHENDYKRLAARKTLTRCHIDGSLLMAVLLLIGVGCFFIYDFTVISAEVPIKSYYLRRQVLFAILGLSYLWPLSRIDYHHLSSLTGPLLIGLAVLHIFVRIAVPSGFIQWQAPYLKVGTLAIPAGQVSELASLVILAHLLALIDLGRPGKSFYAACALSVCVLPVISYNLRGMLILLATFCMLYFLINKWLALICGCTAPLVFLIVSRIAPFAISEYDLAAWLDPFSDPQGSGFAAVQSIYAIADGGALGVGLGNGTMRYAIKDAHSIFMLPAMAQEIGVIGVVMILLLYLFFLIRVFIIAARAVDRFGFYLSAAIMIRYSLLLSLAVLSSVNIIPRIGNLTLPFLSYGGSYLFMDILPVGILLSIGRYQAESARR